MESSLAKNKAKLTANVAMNKRSKMVSKSTIHIEKSVPNMRVNAP